MQPWFKIVKPYPFIESLGMREDLLVADLGDVLTGVAHPMYLEPELFVKTTHFTHGLMQFLDSILRKITTGEGNSIIRLQAQFGGGKTHSLIAVHHLLTNQKFFSQVLPDISLICGPKIVRIIGTHLNPLEGRQQEECHIFTPWGELAYQINGVDGYKSLEKNDQRRISPGKASLFTLLSSSEPTVILLDEITEFIAKARGIKVNDSNLGLQTLIFLQELTECVRSLERSILIVTLPDREYETAKNDDKPLLIEINQILGRLASSAIPSERGDLYQIIQKKLIAEILDHALLDQVLDGFSEFYHCNDGSFPAQSTIKSYHAQMKKAYPFHPETIDILFDKWKHLPSFQGTRTILSILARILNEYRINKLNIPILNISDINFTSKSLNQIFSHHLPRKFTKVLNNEIILLENSVQSRKASNNWKELGMKIISAIFLNSIPSSQTNGLSLQEINLAIWKPDVDLALVSEILDSLLDTLEFFHRRENRYFFAEAPNINKKIKELKHEYEIEALQAIKKSLIAQKIDYAIKIYIWPKSSDEIPDNPKLKLVLASPNIGNLDFDSWIRHKGEKYRKYQNTIILSQPNIRYLDCLKNINQEQIAIQRIIQNKDKEILDKEEYQNLKSKLISLEKGEEYYLNRIYLDFTDSIHQYSLVPPKLSTQLTITWIIQELIRNEVIVKKIHPAYIKENFLISQQRIDTHSLLTQFLKDLNKPKLMNTKILQDSILEGIKTNIFTFENISEGAAHLNSPHQELAISNISFTETEFIGIPDQFIDLSISTNSLQEDKTKDIILKGLSIEFQDLGPKEIRSIRKGILKPLEMEEGDFQLGIIISLRNSENIMNEMTLSLIKETVSQIGGKITKVDIVK
ncbi:MAG: hypothetical protein ACW98F_11710 [Candidatus Hodarchaeales archaeon]